MRAWLVIKREEAGLTQKQVANQSNIERAYYCMIENGTRTPSVPVAKAIGKTLGFNWTLFFTSNGSESTLRKVPN